MIASHTNMQSTALENLLVGLGDLAASDQAADLKTRIDLFTKGKPVIHVLGEHKNIVNSLHNILMQSGFSLAAQNLPINQADLILVCIDATQPLRESERILLQKIRPLSFYVAIDQWEQLDADAHAEVKEWLSQAIPPERSYYVDSRSSAGIHELIDALKKASASSALPASAALRSYIHARHHARRLRHEQQRIRDIQRQIHDFGRALNDRLISDMYSYVASFDYSSLSSTAIARMDNISLLDASWTALPLTKQSELRQEIEAAFRAYVQAVLESWQERALAFIQEDIVHLEERIQYTYDIDLPQNLLTPQPFIEPNTTEQRAVRRAIRAVLLGGDDWLLPTLRRLTLMAFSWMLPLFMLRLIALITLVISETHNLHEQEQRLKIELYQLIQSSVQEYIQDSLSIVVLQAVSLIDSQAFANCLASPHNALDSFLCEQLSAEARAQLAQNSQPILDELNAICRGPLMFTPQRFQHIELSSELLTTLHYSSDYYSSEDTARMNRLLLAEAYPNCLASSIRDTLQQAVAALTVQIAKPFVMPSGEIEALEKIQTAMQEVWVQAHGSAPSPDILTDAEDLWSAV